MAVITALFISLKVVLGGSTVIVQSMRIKSTPFLMTLQISGNLILFLFSYYVLVYRICKQVFIVLYVLH